MNMKKRCKRLLSLFLVCVMVLSLMPATVFAASSQSSANTLTEGSSQKVKIDQTGDEKSFTFTASDSNAYIMYCQYEKDADMCFPTVTASSSNAITVVEPTYINPHPIERYIGYVVEGNAGDSYTMTFQSNERMSYYVTVGVGRPLAAADVNGFSGYYFKPGNSLYYNSLNQDHIIKVSKDEKTLELIFFMDSRFAYDASTTWRADSSKTGVISFAGSKDVAVFDNNVYGNKIGYAPVFNLNGDGTAEITITAEYKGKEVSEVYTVIVGEEQGNGDGDDRKVVNVTSMEALRQNIDSADKSNRILVFEGSGNLIVRSDLTIPEHIEVQFEGHHLIIDENATLTVDGWMACEDLTVAGNVIVNRWFNVNDETVVNGTMTLAKNSFNAGKKLDVSNGKIRSYGQSIHMQYGDNVLNGIENIEFDEEWLKVRIEVLYDSAAELEDKLKYLSKSGNYISDDRVVYTMWVPNDDSTSTDPLVIKQNILVPKHVELNMETLSGYVIENGYKVTNFGAINVNVPLQVNGTLINEGRLDVNYNYQNTGTLTIGSAGSYSGFGELYAHADSRIQTLDELFKNFNLGDFDASYNVDPENHKHWYMQNVTGRTKLATPFNLHWGTEYREMWDWDAQNQMDVIIGFHKLERPGCMSWETDRPDQARAEIMVYRVGETKPVLECSWGFDPQRQPQYRSVDDFMRFGLPSGSYYFTVQSMADSIEYRNSDIADSRYDKDGNFNPAGIYHYVSAADQLSPAVNLKWDDRDDHVVRWATWDDNSNSSYIDGYWVEYYYSPTLNGVYEQYGGSHGRGNTESEMPFENHFLQERGIGYYKFKVKVLSSDIETIGNSEWSAFSPALEVKDISVKVSSDLNQLVNDVNNNNLQPDDIRTAVQNMDTQDLQTALLADKDNVFATQHMAQLEKMAGGPAQVQVTPDASAFNVQDVSIVGANLNNKAEEDDSITLVVDKPQKQHVIPERYNSAVAVRFSMTLENVVDPKHLEVPVKITLPVPSNINPDFLVIMHYDVYGGHELILPHVYEMNGKYYADFVLTSFSDFIMVERLPYQGSDDDNEPAFTKKPAVAENPLPGYVVDGTWTLTDGKWTFADSNGEAYKNKWAAVVNPYAKKEAGHSEFDWFFFDENGFMMTGWVLDAGRWYYLNPVSDGTQGRMLTGWQLIDGKWYYLNTVSDGTKGAMITDAWIDNYYVDANGVWDETKTK